MVGLESASQHPFGLMIMAEKVVDKGCVWAGIRAPGTRQLREEPELTSGVALVRGEATMQKECGMFGVREEGRGQRGISLTRR